MMYEYKRQGKLQLVTLVSDLSDHNSIPSPQCALGTTPHLSIRKKAKEGKEAEERKKEEKEEGGKCPGKDSRSCEE